eukprot:SAG11_NODE_1509_length_4774_cov_5.905668_3_plen_85_part_00
MAALGQLLALVDEMEPSELWSAALQLQPQAAAGGAALADTADALALTLAGNRKEAVLSGGPEAEKLRTLVKDVMTAALKAELEE